MEPLQTRRVPRSGRLTGGIAAPACLLWLALFAAAQDVGTAGPSYVEGQKVEVREGDTWSSATILKHEGRKYRIHYDGADASSDEWVMGDRIRSTGAGPTAGPASAGPASQPVATPKPVAAKPPAWQIGQKVEVKWGGLYFPASVTNKRGDWYFVTYDRDKSREWVEPWRIRRPGSTEDPIGHARPNPVVRRGEGPPRDVPGPAPEPMGAAHHADPAQQAAQAAPDVPLTPTDHSAVREISLEGAPPLAQLAPDAAARPAAPFVTHNLPLKGYSGEFFDSPAALLLSASSGTAAVLHRNAPPGNPSAKIRVERIDLKAGQSLNVAALPLDLEPLDFSADGKLFLGRTGAFGPGKGARLDVWDVSSGEQAKHVVTLLPFDKGEEEPEAVNWAAFVGADHLLALSRGGRLSLFAFRTGAEIWTAKIGIVNPVAISPNARYVATAHDRQVLVLDAMTGKPQGNLELGEVGAATLSFKPDGSRLAWEASEQLKIWDTASGKLVNDLTLVGVRGSSIEWAAEGYLLLDHSLLVELKKQAVVWTYDGLRDRGRNETTTSFDGRFWYISEAGGAQGSRRPVVASIALPDDSVKGILAAVGEPRMAIKPGMSVSLDVSVDGSVQDKVVEALTAKLKQNGLTVAENQPLKLVARSEPGESREITYRKMGVGAFGQTEKLSVQGLKQSLAFQDDGGKVLWQRAGTTSPPFFITMKPGQSAEEAVQERMKPSPAFFQSARLPKFVPKTPGGFGRSRVTATGTQAEKPPEQGS